LSEANETYREAISRREGAEDWVLHEHFAKLLDATSNLAEAAGHWQKVVRLVPQYAAAYYKLGDLAERSGRLQEAEKYFGTVLGLRPESVEAINGLGLVYMTEGKVAAAAQQFERALRIKPIFAPTLARLRDFALAVGAKVLGFIKKAVLAKLGAWAKQQRGYPLLTFVLGKDPVTDEVVARTPGPGE
jgi:tetratricopeptide (TPR) repeat protein